MFTPKRRRLIHKGLRREDVSIRENSIIRKSPRNISYSSGSSNSSHSSNLDEAANEFIDLICKRKWQINKVTSLYNLSYDSRQLSEYAKMLRANIQSKILKGEGELVEVETSNLKVFFSALEGTKLDQNTKPGIKILITSAAKSKEIFCGVLCCINGDESSSSLNNSQLEKSVFLPVLLTNGDVGISNFVTCFLMDNFLCYISKLVLNSNELKWMFAIWCHTTDNIKPKPSKLVYAVPDYVQGIKTIDIDVEYNTLCDIWRTIHDKESSEFTVEEVKDLMQQIQNHIMHIIHIDITFFKLTEIRSMTLAANLQGKIKINNKENVYQVLNYITGFCRDIVMLRTPF